MSSPARDAFLSGRASLQTALDQPFVRAADATGDFIRRGLTVAAYNLLETFVADRLTELTAHINGGHTQYVDLPDALQRSAITNTLRVSARRQRRVTSDLNSLRAFAGEVGTSLAAVGRTIKLSPFTWLWEGSNMEAGDVSRALRLLHSDPPWESVRRLAGRLGFAVADFSGTPIDYGVELDRLASERHACAHDSTYGVSTIWLRSVPELILRYAISFDILASVSAQLLRDGHGDFLKDTKWMRDSRVTVRIVRERRKDYGEYKENIARAKHVDNDGDILFAAACARAERTEAVVRLSITGEVVTWAIPFVG